MPLIITIDYLQDILSIITEEDSIGLEHDTGAKNAVATLQGKIDAQIERGIIQLNSPFIIDETR